MLREWKAQKIELPPKEFTFTYAMDESFLKSFYSI